MRNAAGNIERFRARLVAQAFSQRPGVDYDEVYAPTHRMTTLRALLAVGAAHAFDIEQLDVRTVYLNAPLKYEIYMKMPLGGEGGLPRGGVDTVFVRDQHSASM